MTPAGPEDDAITDRDLATTRIFGTAARRLSRP